MSEGAPCRAGASWAPQVATWLSGSRQLAAGSTPRCNPGLRGTSPNRGARTCGRGPTHHHATNAAGARHRREGPRRKRCGHLHPALRAVNQVERLNKLVAAAGAAAGGGQGSFQFAQRLWSIAGHRWHSVACGGGVACRGDQPQRAAGSTCRGWPAGPGPAGAHLRRGSLPATRSQMCFRAALGRPLCMKAPKQSVPCGVGGEARRGPGL